MSQGSTKGKNFHNTQYIASNDYKLYLDVGGMHDWINGTKSKESTKSKARMDLALCDLCSLSTMNLKFNNLLPNHRESLSNPLFENIFHHA